VVNPGLEVTLGRFVRHVYAIALNVVLPAVVDATQAGLFVAAIKERCPTMRTMSAQNTDPAAGITKGDQVFP
jgi:hypothetical protein